MSGHRLQVREIRFGLRDLLRSRFEGAFQFLIAFKVFLRVFARGKRLVQRDRDILSAVVPVTADEFLCPGFGEVGISLEEFAVTLQLIAFFGIFQLLFLKIEFPRGPLERELQDVPEVGRSLSDARSRALLGKKGLHCLAHAAETPQILRGVYAERDGGEIELSAVMQVDAGGKAAAPYRLQKALQRFEKAKPLRFR